MRTATDEIYSARSAIQAVTDRFLVTHGRLVWPACRRLSERINSDATAAARREEWLRAGLDNSCTMEEVLRRRSLVRQRISAILDEWEFEIVLDSQASKLAGSIECF